MRSILLVIAAAAVSLVASRVLLGEFNAAIMTAVGSSLLLGSWLQMCNLSVIGHGVDGSPHMVGMPFTLFAFYVVLLIAISFIGLTYDPQLLPGTVMGHRMVGIGGMSAWLAGLSGWYGFASRETFERPTQPPANRNKKE